MKAARTTLLKHRKNSMKNESKLVKKSEHIGITEQRLI